MNDYKIQLKVRAWGCKIKSKIVAEVDWEESEVKMGDDLNLKLAIRFDPDDLPTFVEISQEKEPPNQGFVLPERIREEIINAELDVVVPLKYTDGETGRYTIEMVFRHAEFGTRLFDAEPIIFRLVMPPVDIQYCRTDANRISKGREFNIEVGLNSLAPQKVRGILFGRLISNDDLKHKMYELEPKRISIQGEKSVTWHLKTPMDETNTGKFKAIIEFKSKETFSKLEFDDFLEVRQGKLLRVNSLNGSNESISPKDEFSLEAEIENIGLEEIDLEIYPEIRLIEDQKSGILSKKIRDLIKKWSLTPKTLPFPPDAKEVFTWSWEAPEEIVKGQYRVTLNWKDRSTGEFDSYQQELFEVKAHHKLNLVNVISGNESYGPGGDAQIKIQLSDHGTRSGDEIEIIYKIFDIFNQNVYKNSKKINPSDKSTEFTFAWPLPDDVDGGKYDLEVQFLLDNDVLLSKKFTKFFNIELPVKLDIQLIIPSAPRSKLMSSDFTKFLLENESVKKKIDHNKLTIYKLNSNTHLFSLNDDIITYSKDKKSQSTDVQSFIDNLFSYSITAKYLTPKQINEDLNLWNQLGYSWMSLIRYNSDGLNISGIKGNKLKSGKKFSISNWDADLQPIIKPMRDFNIKKSKSIKMNIIFDNRILKNKAIINTTEYRLLSTLTQLIVDLHQSKRFDSVFSKKFNAPNLDKKMKSIKLFYELENVFRSASKFRLLVISKQLQKKFNRILTDWLADARGGRIKRKQDATIYQALNNGYSYLLLFLTSQIISILKKIKKTQEVSPLKFSRLILYEMLYYFIYMQFLKIRIKYAPDILAASSTTTAKLKKGTKDSKSGDNTMEFVRAMGEIKKAAQKFWYFQSRWQAVYSNYLKNMVKRSDIAYINEHVKITTNPIALKGMRGNKSSSKLIVGNNGTRAITLFPNLALPSMHWSLVEPEGTIENNLYNLKRLMIPPKQTKEIPVSITFPKSLSFAEYIAILKINPRPIKLLPERD
jgi:hypothetical protein